MITQKQFAEIIDKLREVNDFAKETNKNARKLNDITRNYSSTIIREYV